MMRLNRFVAQATGCSRRTADQLVATGRITVEGRPAPLGLNIRLEQEVTLDGKPLRLQALQTIGLHKPPGYVTSRRQQGSTPTIYELLPVALHQLKPVGRLDKDSSGLLVLTNDGQAAQRLSHPSAGKWKTYVIELDRRLGERDLQRLRAGVRLDDGPSRLEIELRRGGEYEVRLQEGRNRQIRRSLAALGYRVTRLHRLSLGPLALRELPVGQWRYVTAEELR